MDVMGLSCFDNQPSGFVCINECYNMFSASGIVLFLKMSLLCLVFSYVYSSVEEGQALVKLEGFAQKSDAAQLFPTSCSNLAKC